MTIRTASDSLYGALIDRIAKMEARQAMLQEQLASDIAVWEKASKLVESLNSRVNSLEEALTKPYKHSQFGEEYMTAKAMLAEVGMSKNEEASAMLKFYARKHATENGLEIKKTTEGKRLYEYFPKASANYAMEQLRIVE